ncbi:MAG TPA: magnesium transporter CorA family protein [Acidimicrobiia bacterium]|nr:magnesium transporter CorA family protein [Acidimicrobiia bacterium]
MAGVGEGVAQGMEVWWIPPGGPPKRYGVDDLPGLLARPPDEGFCWVDVPHCDERAAGVLADVFGAHPLAVKDCQEANPTGKVHAYPDHVLLVLHSPEPGQGGQAHLVELDQLVSNRYLVTVHGPSPSGVMPDVALQDTAAVLARMEAGRFTPPSPAHLSHAIVSSVARRQEDYVRVIARKVGALERWALEGDMTKAEEALEEMFRVRHEVLTVATVASLNSTLFARVAALPRFVSSDLHELAEETRNQFEILLGMCEAEERFLQGVLDFYQSRTATKMNLAMERLALITVVLLPVTAVASIYGMNVIVNTDTDFPHLAVALTIMGLAAMATLAWARRQGWW